MKDILFILLMGCLYGALSTFAFAPYNIPLIAWFALCPMLACALKFRNEIYKLILSGFFCSLMLTTFAFHWISSATVDTLEADKTVGISLFLIFGLISSVKEVGFVVIVGLLSKRIVQPGLNLNIFLIASIAVLVDTFSPKIIPYSWGNIIGKNVYLVQIIEYTGVLGLTFIVFLVNAAIYKYCSHGFHAFKNEQKLVKEIQLSDFAFAFILCLCLSFGFFRSTQLKQTQSKLETTRIAAIQPNSPLVNVNKMEQHRELIYALVGDVIPGLIRQANRAADYSLDMIVLPEASVPFSSTDNSDLTKQWYLYSQPLHDMILAMSNEQQVEILLNEPSVIRGDGKAWQNKGVPVNSMVLFSRSGIREDVYFKNKLFPIGEEFPFTELLEWAGLIDLVPRRLLESQYISGKQNKLIKYNVDGQDQSPKYFIPLICYEATFFNYVRSFFNNFSDQQVDFIVNTTQDGWFSNSIAPHQHFELMRLRAIETRRAILRSANRGFSALIGLDGQVIPAKIGPDIASGKKEGFQVWDVPVNRNEMTFFTRFGDSVMLSFVILIILMNLNVTHSWVFRSKVVTSTMKRLNLGKNYNA